MVTLVDAMNRIALRSSLIVIGGVTLLGAALAQESVTDASCHPESVVLTRCDAPPATAGVPDSPAAKAAREDARKKAELAAALERQRQRNAEAASGATSEGLDRAQVSGQRLHTPTAAEVFDSYFGTPKILAPDITQNTDQMGNRTECITQCVGPFCCKTVPANPGTPGVINGNP